MVHTLLLTLHIGGGCTAIFTGFLSMVFRKGGKSHRLLGTIFFYAMIAMAGSATYLASFVVFEKINMAIGLFTLYLVLTGKWAASNRSGRVTNRDRLGSLFVLLLFLAFTGLSIMAIRSGETAIDGVYVEAYYVYAVLALLALILDLKVTLGGGVLGAHRNARHLWRMILALFIACGSFFLGQPQVFPEFIRSSGVLNIPVLLVVVSLFYWLVRVYIGKRFKRKMQMA